MRHGFKFQDSEYDVGLSRSADGYRLHRDGEQWPFTLPPSHAKSATTAATTAPVTMRLQGANTVSVKEMVSGSNGAQAA